MKATITIIIEDATTQETLEGAGCSVKMVQDLYRAAFTQFIQHALIDAGTLDQVKAQIDVQVTDNTKEAGA